MGDTRRGWDRAFPPGRELTPPDGGASDRVQKAIDALLAQHPIAGVRRVRMGPGSDVTSILACCAVLIDMAAGGDPTRLELATPAFLDRVVGERASADPGVYDAKVQLYDGPVAVVAQIDASAIVESVRRLMERRR